MANLTRELEAKKRELAETKSKLPAGLKTIKLETETGNIAAVPGFKGLPTGISNILFGGSESSSPVETTKPGNGSNQARDPRKRPGPVASTSTTAAEKSSTLATMSDEDLLAKAAQELADLSKPGQAAPEPTMVFPPPAFPTMPNFPPPPVVPTMPHFPPPATGHDMIPPPPTIGSMRPPGFVKPGVPWARSFEPRGAEHPAERSAPRSDWQQQQGDRNWNRRDDDGRRDRGGSAAWNERGNRNASWNERGDRREDRHRPREGDDYDRRGGYGHKQVRTMPTRPV